MYIASKYNMYSFLGKNKCKRSMGKIYICSDKSSLSLQSKERLQGKACLLISNIMLYNPIKNQHMSLIILMKKKATAILKHELKKELFLKTYDR